MKVGGVLYMLQLAIVEDFTADFPSGGPFLFGLTKSLRRKHQLSMNLLRTVNNTRYR